MCERVISNKPEALNFKTFLAWRQPWWRLATFEFLLSFAVYPIAM